MPYKMIYRFLDKFCVFKFLFFAILRKFCPLREEYVEIAIKAHHVNHLIELSLIMYIIYTVIIAKVREVRENIKRNRLIWRIIQLWCFHHYHIVISHNTI